MLLKPKFNLYLKLQLIELPIPCVVAINIIDFIRKNIQINN